MKFISRFLALTALLAFIAPAHAQLSSSGIPSLDLKVAYPNLKFTLPLWMTESPDGTKRQFIVEQDGRIWILPKDRAGSDPVLFLDISNRRPHRQSEEGLLSMIFHPNFKENGLFYLFYSQQGPKRDVISEVRVSRTDPNKADLSTERIVLEVLQPYWNHNGGAMLFGPDGYLYLSFGDGGNGGDPHLFGQNGHQLLGKIIRIDVNSRTGNLAYGIPKDNPFVAKDKAGALKTDPFDTKPEGIRPEIWAYGLRNAWRMSFDRETGDLWAGDVGQNKWEEIHIITKGGNYGWSVREGFHAFKQQKSQGELVEPIIEYPHTAALASECKFPEHGIGLSVTGGYVYRGKKIPSLRGVYLYADHQVGTIWGLRYENGKVTSWRELVGPNALRLLPSFAEDSDGEVYVVSFDGRIYEFVERK